MPILVKIFFKVSEYMQESDRPTGRHARQTGRHAYMQTGMQADKAVRQGWAKLVSNLTFSKRKAMVFSKS